MNKITVNISRIIYGSMYAFYTIHTPNQVQCDPHIRMARMARKRVFKTKARGKCLGRKILPSIYCRNTCSGDPLRAA